MPAGYDWPASWEITEQKERSNEMSVKKEMKNEKKMKNAFFLFYLNKIVENECATGLKDKLSFVYL